MWVFAIFRNGLKRGISIQSFDFFGLLFSSIWNSHSNNITFAAVSRDPEGHQPSTNPATVVK